MIGRIKSALTIWVDDIVVVLAIGLVEILIFIVKALLAIFPISPSGRIQFENTLEEWQRFKESDEYQGKTK